MEGGREGGEQENTGGEAKGNGASQWAEPGKGAHHH